MQKVAGGQGLPFSIFSIQILSIFLWYFQLLPNFIFQWYRPQTFQFYLFPALFISGIHKVPGIKLRVGMSCDHWSSKGPIGRINGMRSGWRVLDSSLLTAVDISGYLFFW